MARTPHDPVAALLRQTPLPKAVRADAWDAFHRAKTPDDLTPRLHKLPLPTLVRAHLWDLKHKHTTKREASMGPRESKYGRGGARLPDDAEPRRLSRDPREAPGAVSTFLAEHFRHFNAATLHDAAEAYNAHIAKGGQMLVSLAGAMSTAELGRCLAPMIRANKIHAISCTGANLEEDLFNLVAHDEYERMPDYHELTSTDDAALATRNINRVTDTGIPEQAAMTPIEEAVTALWKRNRANGVRVFPHEILYELIERKTLEAQYQGDPANSWLVAAQEAHLPIVVPGWEDSTLGNVFAAECLAGTYPPTMVKGGIEYMMTLAGWYQHTSKDHPMGFCQIGGGIAGDFSICVVPLLAQDAKVTGVPKWQYFVQFTDADETMGGYSGALPNEKASWGKLPPDAPMFNVKGDATISFPLLCALVLRW